MSLPFTPDLITGLLVLAGLIVLAALAGTVWLALGARRTEARRSALRERLAAVSGRRLSRDNTLAQMFMAMAEVTGAQRSALYLPDAQEQLVLIEAHGVRDLTGLVRLSSADGWLARLNRDNVVLATAPAQSPWASLAEGGFRHLIGFRLGATAADGLMVFAWRSRLEAEFNLPALQEAARDSRRVVHEFAEIQRQARAIQREIAQRQTREATLRTGAHDIGNRIQAILAQLDRSRSEATPNGGAERAMEQIELLGRMVEDMLDPERSVEWETVPVAELLTTVSGWIAELTRPGVLLEVADHVPGAQVRADRLELLRVFDNLIRNAIRHNPDPTSLAVRVSARRAALGALEFEVADNGCGIPLEAQGQLFEIGFRVDAGGQVRGHGIGLYSVRRILERHGTTIQLESRPGQGARFSFMLPTA